MLPKQYRLPASQFRLVFRTGRKLYADDYTCVFSKTSSGVSRFAFVVSTKVAKKAVDRNRMKRVLRESIRRLLPTIKPGYDMVFIVKKNFTDKPSNEIAAYVSDLLKSMR